LRSFDRVPCAHCGVEHDLSDIEPTYRRPDCVLQIPEDERAFRLWEGKDFYGVRSADNSTRQFFLRALLPIPVRGEDRTVNWGIWVEVTEKVFKRVSDLWDEPEQASEPPFDATLANTLAGYSSTLGLPGQIQLIGPSSIPAFRLTLGLDNPIAAEQREGVWPERVIEWAVRHVHGPDHN
jgi:hypothetical protein